MLSLLLWVTSAVAEPQDLHPERTEVPVGRVDRIVALARERLGEPYRWEGRGTDRFPGYDCLGILFRSFGAVDGRSWRTYEVNPSELVANGKLGAPVDGLDGILRDELDPVTLAKGDVLYFLLRDYRIPDDPLLVRGEAQYWPWHTGLYVGDGRVLHARPGESVMEQSLDSIAFDAVFVTRGLEGR